MSKKCSAIKAVLFDLGNVLVDFDHRIATVKLLPFCGKNKREICDFFLDSPLISLFEEGKITPEEFFLRIQQSIRLKLDYEDFVTIWNEIFFFSRKNQAVYELARHLKTNCKIALLSNTNILHFNYLKKSFPVWDIFDQMFLSFELKLKKPDPLIYKKVLEELNLPPEAVFYTDDREDFVRQAQLEGIRAVVFSGISQLKNDLICSSVDI